jgi:AcrR family transcriptional regulator
VTAPFDVDELLGRRGGDAEDARRLVEACRDVITETGNVDPPMSAVLKRAGLASRTFQRLFPGKQDLLLAVIVSATDRAVAYMRERLTPEMSPRERITGWIDLYVGRATSSAGPGSAALFLDAPRFGVMYPRKAAELEARIVGPLEEAVTELRAGAADPGRDHADSVAVYDLATAAVTRALARQDPITPGTMAHLHEYAWRILGGRRPGA